MPDIQDFPEPPNEEVIILEPVQLNDPVAGQTDTAVLPAKPQLAEPGTELDSSLEKSSLVCETLTSEQLACIIDLPEADSFKAAVEKLCLPKIQQEKPFEYTVKLFHINNSFEKKIRIESVEAPGRSDISVTLNPEKKLLFLKGTPESDEKILLKFRYSTISILSRVFTPTINEYLKEIPVSPDPVVDWSRTLKQLVKIGILEPEPKTGQAGKYYEERLSLKPDPVLRSKVTFLSAQVLPECGLAVELSQEGEFTISGTPKTDAHIELDISYRFLLGKTWIEEKIMIPFTKIFPEEAFTSEEQFKKAVVAMPPKRFMAGSEVKLELDLKPFADERFIEIEKIEMNDEKFTAEYNYATGLYQIFGVPGMPGIVTANIIYSVNTYRGKLARVLPFQLFNITPDPKTLWKNLPTDPTAPYQAKDNDFQILQAGEKIIAGASKRGRSHAHEGKFRDDNFKIVHLPETGWSIAVVSDGAGSAKFSREGSRITCETFCQEMSAKLALPEINQKIDTMAEKEREKALKTAVVNAAYQCLAKIDEESKKAGHPRKDYSATFLGYIMKKFGEQWLIVSMGIGDGIIALLDRQDHLQLLSEPDGGEFVGQTRFITMNEVWQDNPAGRVRVAKVDDFGIIMSMTDGVSDPKFETDNNLKNEELWLALWNDIRSQVPLQECSEDTARKLCSWLDFWSKGNHDDRTIVLVY